MKSNIIITGGAQGIGKITAIELLKNNYTVSIFDKDEEALNEIDFGEHNKNCSLHHVDVSQEESVTQAINDSLKKFRGIYGLINNAAISINKPISELTIEEWLEVMNCNLTGTFLCSKLCLPYLKESNGCIINMSSTRAFQSEADTEAYSASKGGIYSFTHALAISAGPLVRVNCISPGWIDVSGIKKKSAAKQLSLSQKHHKQHPTGRVGKAKDITKTVLYLLDKENDFVTGQNFVIDGGMSCKMIYV